jgi:glycosidase
MNKYEFHISKNSREKFKFDDLLFSLSGNVIFADHYAIRLFVKKINDNLDLVNYPEQAVKAGQINALGLIDEVMHFILQLYKQENGQFVIDEIFTKIEGELDSASLSNTLIEFVDEFPPSEVTKNKSSVKKYLTKKSNRKIALEELVNLYLANANPAFMQFNDLFDDSNLSRKTDYRKIIIIITDYFKNKPFFGPENQSLMDMLRTPALKVPHSLNGQLEYIQTHWGHLISQLLMRIIGGLDLIKEEEKPFFGGPGPTHVQDFANNSISDYDEPERFSDDVFWMPNVVMMAKSTYVWLDQLSKKYEKNIFRLDHIPDVELDLLSSRGYTALWLIGIWERSPASQKIKQIMGNPEAVSSAYSLFDYVIAEDLGGEGAYQNLKDRAWQRGLRLASDMVPNHTGIFSKWIIEHPDWFVQSDFPPFPNYSFTGQNLSDDDGVGIYIEDGYWNHSDAAVVFKRVNHHTGETKYIFHGNDGTSMPWNDTAQLNYLKAEVREAVIQTILHVARKFPIIRFDAAMTLAKKHFQRLWFPHPGSGGDIPSRAEQGLSKEKFDEIFPAEFWREVVDRVAQEVPDTLLLAEAFWMMEGYFVRTLGMHRVYNSAFMNMLKNEENGKYRQSIKNVMEFNPGILKRYVNFMNNPDEDTAVAQFGKDDKYFGVCTVMATMPGLPMFGHGQLEGFAEKYGMEYRKAYWEEKEDGFLIERHNREIFPILKKRYIFSEVENFVLYDFISTDGLVNDNVFAYSNGAGDEKALVLYNNKFEETKGKIHYSSAASKSEYNILSNALQLNIEPDYFCVFKDQINGLEYIRNNQSIINDGLYVELGAFKYHVFWQFRQIKDNEYSHYHNLENYLNGSGVPNIEEALKETFLSPIHVPFKELMNTGFISFINISLTSKKDENKILKEFETKFANLTKEIGKFQKTKSNKKELTTDALNEFQFLFKLTNKEFKLSKSSIKNSVPLLFSFLLVNKMNQVLGKKDLSSYNLSILKDWLLGKIIYNVFTDFYKNEYDAEKSYLALKVLLSNSTWCEEVKSDSGKALKKLFSNEAVQKLLHFNRYQEVLYFNSENFEELLKILFLNNLLMQSDKKLTGKQISDSLAVLKKVGKAAKSAGYRVSEVVEYL